MIEFNEQLHGLLQELKTATDPAEKSRIVRACVDLYRELEAKAKDKRVSRGQK